MICKYIEKSNTPNCFFPLVTSCYKTGRHFLSVFTIYLDTHSLWDQNEIFPSLRSYHKMAPNTTHNLNRHFHAYRTVTTKFSPDCIPPRAASVHRDPSYSTANGASSCWGYHDSLAPLWLTGKTKVKRTCGNLGRDYPASSHTSYSWKWCN